jgi:hypothetical protein
MIDRGILYVVWGDTIEASLERSIASVRRVYPNIPIRVERLDGSGLGQKASMADLSPFRSTLYLDADTVVMGNLDFAFEKAEQFGLACCICEAPWMARYGDAEGIEYNTGVLFFTSGARRVFDNWKARVSESAKSTWTMVDGIPRGLSFDDQAGFARAIAACEFNPFILPINYNQRPYFHRSLFLPLKIWHDYGPVPESLIEMNGACERGERPITYYLL